mmetsp:Transcript_22151/g.61556  ORF Transcript_22151/g.61556 Transcript_22151/m.61556 type:complete len:88 (-) Transcript_22151:999-1262(-)
MALIRAVEGPTTFEDYYFAVKKLEPPPLTTAMPDMVTHTDDERPKELLLKVFRALVFEIDIFDEFAAEGLLSMVGRSFWKMNWQCRP